MSEITTNPPTPQQQQSDDKKTQKQQNVLTLPRGSMKGMGAIDKQKIYKFTRHKKITASVYGAIGSDSAWSFKFTLDSLDNYTEFTSLFDLYRIDKIVFRLIPLQNTVEAPATQKDVGLLYGAVDLDDYAGATVATLCQYPNMKIANFDEKLTFAFKPKFAVAAYSGAFTSYANTGGWIDMGSPSVEHYGLKLNVASSTAVIPSWTCVYTVDLSCRCVR
jgi:hypothetical protein